MQSHHRTDRITTVLFDLDGTIVDTNELIIQSVLHALQGEAPAGFGREHIIPSMGLPLAVQMTAFTGRDSVDDLIALYREYNYRHHDEMVALFPGVPETVAALRAGGIRLGIVTTKMRETTERALKLLGLYDAMDAIVTIDDVEHPKPHPEPVRAAMALLGSEPRETLMVGDSPVDIEAAIAAGAVPVGVAWSLKGAEPLERAGAKHVVLHMEELLRLCGIGGAGR